MKTSEGKIKKQLQAEIEDRFSGTAPVSLRPEPGPWQGYGPPPAPASPAIPGSIFDPQLLVLTLSGKRLALLATLKLTAALRGAILAACADPIPEWLSGHAADSRPTSRPHIALLPLSFVGAEHADGQIMGVALALPRMLDATEAAHYLDPLLHDADGLPRRIRLFDGQWLECTVALEGREAPPMNLRASTWTAPSRLWASVTPVALDRHFGGKDKWTQAAETVQDACERIGLPRPREVLLHPVSLHEGKYIHDKDTA